MGRPFRSVRGAIQVGLDPAERELLAQVLQDVEGLLAGAADHPAADGLDPERPAAVEAEPQRPADADELWRRFEADLAAPPPQDPAVARLLPTGNRDDPELAEGFRRLTEAGLRERKRSGLVLAAEALRRPGHPRLAEPEAVALLKGMTDVRLVLAERLGVRTDADAEGLGRTLASGQAPSSTWQFQATLYEVLTYWQESLVQALH